VRRLLLLISHAAVGLAGFALGIYLLPILIAPDAPADSAVGMAAANAEYKAEFKRDLADSDIFHWGEGTVFVTRKAISLKGRLSPGPDYRLYLSPEFVETEKDFMRLKPTMVQVGEVKTFENFIVPMPEGLDPSAYKAVIVWCERFREFITAAKYR